MTRFGKQPERTIEDIGRDALHAAMKDAGVGRDRSTKCFAAASSAGR